MFGRYRSWFVRCFRKTAVKKIKGWIELFRTLEKEIYLTWDQRQVKFWFLCKKQKIYLIMFSLFSLIQSTYFSNNAKSKFLETINSSRSSLQCSNTNSSLKLLLSIDDTFVGNDRKFLSCFVRQLRYWF